MGLTKQYLRYIPAGNFNIVASQACNVCFVTLDGQEGRFVAVGACEHIIIWDLRLGEKAQVLPGEKSVVTSLAASPNKRHLAAGYSNGDIQIYDLKSAEVISIFSGHKSEVTTLIYDNFGHKLASGSKDTDIITWDTVAEVGLSRLSGHKGPITQLQFMKDHAILISSSKDSFVKFWDLDTQHCFKTLTGHQSEVWSITLMKDDQYLVTGCGDMELTVYKLFFRDPDSENKNPLEHLSMRLELSSLEDSDDLTHPLQCHKAGTLLRGGRGRVISMYSDVSGHILGCHGTDKKIELFQFVYEEDAKLRLKKRLKKEKKKNKSEGNMETDQEDSVINPTNQLSLCDEVKRLPSITLSDKPKSFHLVLGNGGELRIATNLSNNVVELYSIQSSAKDSEPKRLRSILHQGHRTDVRSVCFSSDNLAIASGSAESVKLWNRPSQACLRTISTQYILSTVFVPGDRHLLAGLKNGMLLIIDIASGDILEEIPAHSTELWSVILTHDLRGCVTGGGDSTVKFWQFELVVDKNSDSKAKVLSVLHTKTLKLEDTVLCLKMSPNGKFIAVGLLDSTVKIFFVDTLKFYLSLYGHKLPVLCLDISSDSTLIATGSVDRNVKIWGMDFGDCHKSIFAHDDSVTGLCFVPKTHYFFTCGKDGKVKEWDGDTYDKIMTLQGHVGEARGLAISSNGQYVVSCGADRVLRMYQKSDQILVLEDEREEEREQEDELATGEQTVIPGHPGLNLPSKKTVGSEKATESILECLEICEKYKEQLAEHAAHQAASNQTLPVPIPPPLMLALQVSTPDDFLLETIKRIRPSDLEEALLMLPFSSVCEILQAMPALLTRGNQTELVCKISMFLLKLHYGPIVANHSLLTTLEKILKFGNERVGELRDLVGYNYYAMKFIQNEVEAAEGVQLFRDASQEKTKSNKKRRQREKLKRSIMVMS
ncbi:WD repeat-containing protein 3 [Diorhabda carinulata]|uniref:WD repeat-containing protein 3 n=1 Tax=Diorhabda carinulata TaxID=1163345 RepID=UPI0025A15EAD|nr:WD repeat-containing protein 3 [Diorhabda carinulata]